MGNGRRLGALALTAVLATGLAACGGDDSDDDDASSVEEQLDDALDDIDADDLDDLDAEDIEDISGLSGECAVFAEMALAIGQAMSGSSDADLGDFADALEEVSDEAPDEIREDVAILAEAYAQFAEVFGDIDMSDPEAFTDPEIQEALTEASAIFEEPEVAEAQANVEAFTAANCQ